MSHAPAWLARALAGGLAIAAGALHALTPPGPDLDVTIKRGRFGVDAGGTVSGWLVVANRGAGPARAAGSSGGSGYEIEMVLAEDARLVTPRPQDGGRTLGEPVVLEQVPDLEGGGETVLEFHVSVPRDLPQPAVICARAVWRGPGRGNVNGRNVSCSRLELTGRPLPVIRHLFSGGFAGVMGQRLMITADGVVRARGGELELSESEHRRLVQRARRAVEAGAVPGGGCPDGFTYTLEVGEQSASVNQCVSSGPLAEMFDVLEALADRVEVKGSH